MPDTTTILTKQEKNWLLEPKVTRLTDNKEVQIYPMGAERYLSSTLFGQSKDRYPIQQDITDKNILVIPGYGNSAFLFAQAGAQSVTVYDKDPVTIAWVKAFKKYYHYRENTSEHKPYPSIGELLTALTQWYPPLIQLPSGRVKNKLSWLLNPKSLRRTYIHYMLSLVKKAIESKSTQDHELDKHITFHTGELSKLIKITDKPYFDTAFVPYLLGVKNGIETANDIALFITEIIKLVPHGAVIVSPARDMKELSIIGKSYFVTTGYANIRHIPDIQQYFKIEDPKWFRNQGLAVFGANNLTE